MNEYDRLSVKLVELNNRLQRKIHQRCEDNLSSLELMDKIERLELRRQAVQFFDVFGEE